MAQKLERRRVLDAGAAGLMMAPLLEPVDFVQTAPGQPAALTANSTVVLTPSTTDLNEGESLQLGIAFTDADPTVAHTLSINWGDGTPTETHTLAAGANQFSAFHRYRDDNPTGTPSDLNRIVVNVTDPQGTVATGETTISVTNLLPQITSIAFDGPIVENQTAFLRGTFTDPGTRDTFFLDIDWDGDGQFDVGVLVRNGEFLVGRHYLDNPPGGGDTFNVNVRLRDDDGGVATASTQVTVLNARPTIDSLAVTTPINENGIATLTGTYSDPGRLDTHTLQVDWDGDNVYDETVVVAGGAFQLTHQFLDDNPTGTQSDTFPINVRLADDDGGQDAASVELTVNNVAPTIQSLGITSPIIEGQIAFLTGTFTDPGTRDTFLLDVDFTGDGQFEVTALVSNGAFQVGWLYFDDQPGMASDTFDVNVRLRDDDGGVATASTPVTVLNAPPTINSLNVTSPINENGIATLTGTYSDPGPLDTHTLQVDWDGDNVYDETVNVAGGAFQLTHQFLDDNPTGTSSDTFPINVRLVDDDGGETTALVNLTVNNVAPLNLQIDPLEAIDENGVANLRLTFADPGTLDTHTAVVDWGDGRLPDTIPIATGAREFTASHQYLDDNPTGTFGDVYTIRVTVTDDDGGAGQASANILVNNLSPMLTVAGNQIVNEGAVLDLTGGALGSFTNPGTLDTHTATVDWGDGTLPESVLLVETGGAGTLSAEHIYADNGVYTVTVNLFDDDTGGDQGTFMVEVANVDPNLVDADPANVVPEGQEFTLGQLGITLTDPGFSNIDNPLIPGGSMEILTAATIDWGDGTSDVLTVVNLVDGARNRPTTAEFFHDPHTYADNGLYTVTVTIADDDGGPVKRTFQIEVQNVAPTLTLTNRVLVINEGETLVLGDLGMFEDPGFDNPLNTGDPSNGGELTERFTYDIDWGDGATDSGQLPATLTPGRAGTFTKGTLSADHQYLDNDVDNRYTITVTLSDDDGETALETIEVFVFNVNPSLDPLVATDVNTRGQANLTLDFADPGTEQLTVWVDWGDRLALPSQDRFVPETVVLGPGAQHVVLTHTYSGPPNPLNPTADILISAFIRDDDFAPNALTISSGQGNTQRIAISNPGLGTSPIRIDTSPQVPRLEFPPRTEMFVADEGTIFDAAQQDTLQSGGAAGEAEVASERYFELRVVSSTGRESDGYRLPNEVLDDLPGLFRTLPDNHYKIYLVQVETNTRRLVIEVYVRNGKLIDPGDDSEGTRDRPPTDEAAPPAAEQLPADEAPAEAPAPAADAAVGARALHLGGVAVGLAATASARNWAERVDRALAGATAQQWRRLRNRYERKIR